MPRGRPRKPRLSRLDAAVDAMAPFGFPEEKVKKHVKELLNAYGGDEGWPFIEEYSYKELIDAILRDGEENDQEQVAEDGLQLKESSLPETSCSRVSDSHQNEGPLENIPETLTEINSDILPDSANAVTVSNIQIPTSPAENTIPSPLPTNSLPTHRRRFPCYGWIESDEEEVNDFIFLKPALKSTLPQDLLSKKGRSERKRRSRWDEKPDGIQ